MGSTVRVIFLALLCLSHWLHASNQQQSSEADYIDVENHTGPVSLDDYIWVHLLTEAVTNSPQEQGRGWSLIDNQIVRTKKSTQPLYSELVDSIKNSRPLLPEEPSPEAKAKSSLTQLTVFHWQISDDNPAHSYKYNARLERLHTEITQHLNSQSMTSDIYIFSGISSTRCSCTLTSLCRATLEPTLDQCNDLDIACPSISDKIIDQLPDVSSHMLYYKDFLILSHHPIRSIAPAGYFPHEYCYTPTEKKTYISMLFFEAQIGGRWVKFSILTGHDHTNLTLDIDWQRQWKFCTKDVLIARLNGLLLDNEPAVIVTRVMNKDIKQNNLMRWFRSSALPSIDTQEFQPELNPLAMEIANEYNLNTTATQFTSIFYYKKKKKISPIQSDMHYYNIHSNRLIHPVASIIQHGMLAYLESYWQTTTHYFSPYNPVRAKIKLKSDEISLHSCEYRTNMATMPSEAPDDHSLLKTYLLDNAPLSTSSALDCRETPSHPDCQSYYRF